MNRTYHWILAYSDKDNRWTIDIDSEERAFNNGTIYDEDEQTWEFGYGNDGTFVGNEQELTKQLCETLDRWNSLLKTGN